MEHFHRLAEDQAVIPFIERQAPRPVRSEQFFGREGGALQSLDVVADIVVRAVLAEPALHDPGDAL
ncbi:hypothetical protein ACFW16_32575 [Inquilinus sp. NPDC058860]|uniref:hypothetical protein n=1 Tax=Inquilinus sp. NPDC058860 TaxID=3346652 RepID=UPI00369781F2